MSEPRNYYVDMPVANESSNNSLLSYFLSQRVIWIFEPINDVSAKLICMQLIYLNGRSFELPINLNIHSGGGSVYAALAILNTIAAIKAPVYTTICGFSASAAAVIAVFGKQGHRNMLPYARIMFHQVLSASPNYRSMEDIHVEYAETYKLNKLLLEMIFERIKVSKKEFSAKIKRDWFLSAEEAKSYGVIDNIIEAVPHIHVNTSSLNLPLEPNII